MLLRGCGPPAIWCGEKVWMKVAGEVTYGGVGDGRAIILCAAKWLAKQQGSAQYEVVI